MLLNSELFPRERKTALPGGYMGKILRVDLSSGTMKDENLPEEPVLRKFLGGQALALYTLLHELPLDAKPLGPESKVVLMTGPITGTGLTPGGTKVTAIFLSPLTGHTLGRGASSGFWAVYLKAAGYDGVIVEGVAQRPTYLFINNGKAELRDASRVWGKGSRDTEDLLREEVGSKDARVLCIGPAGENLNAAAMLCNDYNHSASHSGGAIFGSKKLKAIVVDGTMKPPIHDKERLIETGFRWRQTLRVNSGVMEDAGHAVQLGAVPNLNYRSTLITDHARGFDKNRVTLRPCFQCQSCCPEDVELRDGSHPGVVGHFNAGSEWMDTFFNLGVKGSDALYLAEKINDVGIECSHFSCGVAVAFEAWEKGLLGPDQTDGLRFEWGDVETISRLLDMAAHREGRWGNLFADGPTHVADAIGGDAHQWVVHTKKGTPALHDWRPHFGQMIREIVASGGMKPQGGGSASPPPDLAHREKWGPLDRDDPTGWPWSQVLSERHRQFVGLIGGCWFAVRFAKADALNSVVDSLNATTGWDFNLDEGLDAGSRSVVLQSIFALQRGWSAEDDWKDVGPRFLEPVPDGKYKGFTVAKWFPDLIEEYYSLSGRHPKTGRPYMDTLAKLGLEEFSEWGQLD